MTLRILVVGAFLHILRKITLTETDIVDISLKLHERQRNIPEPIKDIYIDFSVFFLTHLKYMKDASRSNWRSTLSKFCLNISVTLENDLVK